MTSPEYLADVSILQMKLMLFTVCDIYKYAINYGTAKTYNSRSRQLRLSIVTKKISELPVPTFLLFRVIFFCNSLKKKV